LQSKYPGLFQNEGRLFVHHFEKHRGSLEERKQYNVALQLRRAKGIRAEGIRLLEKQAIAPSVASACSAGPEWNALITSDLHIWPKKDNQFQRTFFSIIHVIGNVIMISRCFGLIICQLAKAFTNFGKISQSSTITLDFELTALQSDNFQLVLVWHQEDTPPLRNAKHIY